MTAEERLLKNIFGEDIRPDEPTSTKGIEKNMHAEIDNLVRKAYEEGKKVGYKIGKNDVDEAGIRGEGVRAAWDALNDLIDKEYGIGEDEDGKPIGYEIEHPAEFVALIIDTLKTCPFEIMGNCEEEEEEPPERAIEMGDVVLDPSGNKCTVTNADTHIHVIYENGKTHKWKKTEKFTRIGEAKITLEERKLR